MESGRSGEILRSIATFAIGLAIVILMWEMLALYVNEVKGVVMKFPTPVETLGQVWEWFAGKETLMERDIGTHVAASLKRWFTAFAFASVFGIALGSILGYFEKIYSIGIVPVTVLQTIPGLAWLPIAILLFGLGDDAAVFIIFAVSSMVITINVAGGIRMVPDTVVRAGGMMGADKPTLFLKILIPFAAVDILNGLRVGMGSAWRVLIAAEMLIGKDIGLGTSMEIFRENLFYVEAFACIAIICIIGLLVDKILFTSIEKYARHKLGMEEGY